MRSFHEKLFPELLLFEPGIERRRMNRRMYRNIRTFGTCFLFAAIFVFGVKGILRSSLAQLGLPHWAVRMAVFFCFLVVAYAAVWATQRGVRRFLRVQLVKKGVSVCLNCGYQLRGQVEPRCPECGTGFDMRLPPQGRSNNE